MKKGLTSPLPWLCLTFTMSFCQHLGLPSFAGYKPEFTFPTISGQLHTSTRDYQQPFRQMSLGFHLNPPPTPSFLQSFPINHDFFSEAKNSFKNHGFLPGRFFGAPLFTPNTIKRVKPQTEGQEEEYRKYLKEEAEELEKEKNQNVITTDFTDFSVEEIESTSLQPSQNTFVRLNVHGKDYSYST